MASNFWPNEMTIFVCLLPKVENFDNILEMKRYTISDEGQCGRERKEVEILELHDIEYPKL